jgi:hypothetical protein
VITSLLLARLTNAAKKEKHKNIMEIHFDLTWPNWVLHMAGIQNSIIES